LTVNSNNISAVNSLGFRNRIINGAMVIDQRNNGASITPTSGGIYSVDRWQHSLSQPSKFSVQRNAGSVTPPAGYTNYLGITSLSAYSVVSGDFFSAQQPIEGFNVADLGWGAAGAQSVTLSFWVRSSLTGTFGGSIRNGLANRSYPFSYTISAANTWEYKTLSIAGDVTGTWATDNAGALILAFSLGAGSTFSGTAGAWSGSNLLSATGAVSVVGTSGATFYITGVQLEAGSVATPFERRDYGRELAMCQRYFQRTQSFFGAGQTGNQISALVLPAVEMRAAPSVSQSAVLTVTDYYSADITQGSTGVTITNSTRATANSLQVQIANLSGAVSARFYGCAPNVGSNGFILLSSEL
jgi:hypothetical protein